MQNWGNFFVATAGVSAAVVGFIFISFSISLKQILSFPALPSRTLDSLLLPIAVLITSCCGLVPGQAPAWMGVEVLVIGLLTAGGLFWLGKVILDLSPATYRRFNLLNLIVSQVVVVLYVVAGILLIVAGWPGVYWLVPAITFSFIKVIYDAWVLLVVINR